MESLIVVVIAMVMLIGWLWYARETSAMRVRFRRVINDGGTGTVVKKTATIRFGRTQKRIWIHVWESGDASYTVQLSLTKPLPYDHALYQTVYWVDPWRDVKVIDTCYEIPAPEDISPIEVYDLLTYSVIGLDGKWNERKYR